MRTTLPAQEQRFIPGQKQGGTASICLLIALASSLSFGTTRPDLTTAKQVRALSPDEARLGLPVHVRGQVLLLSGWKNSFFFSDGNIGISVDRNDTLPELHSGDQVEVFGKTSAGLFAPVIVSDQVRVMSKATASTKLPAAPLLDYSELAGGTEDSQFVRVRGVVHSAKIAPSWGHNVLFIDIDLGASEIQARVRDFTITDPSYLVDSEVSVRGVCGTNFNQRRQFVGLRLFVSDMNEVTIEKPPRADPFDQPVGTLDSIQRFGHRERMQHRIRVTGVVTYQRLGTALYMQDGDKGLYVETSQRTAVSPGGRIDVVGFPGAGPYSPKLQAAIFRVLESVAEPPPHALSPSAVIYTTTDGFLNSNFDGVLVRLRAKLVDRIPGSTENVLAMSDGKFLFRAFLGQSTKSEPFPDLRPGSELDLTGVVSLQADPSGEPRIFVLLLRSPSDIVVVNAASWWDYEHTRGVLTLVTVTAFASIVAVIFLRRKVNHQVTVIRHSLEASEAALKALADQKFALDQHASVSMTDTDGRITYVNDNFCALSKYSKRELIGQNHRILKSGYHSKEFYEQMYAAITNGKVWHGEIMNRAKDGSFYWLDTTIVPTLNADGKPRQYVSIRADITERKRAEEALEESRQSQIRLKDELLSHVSHELRSPLTAIKQFTNILLNGIAGELTPQQREFQKIILRNVLQLQSMVDDLLEVARLEAGKLGVVLERISVPEALTDSLNTLQVTAGTKNISLSADLARDLPRAYADPTRLRQVLIILIDNAVKFTPNGGEVKLSARLRPRSEDFILIEVSDTGCGMSAEDAAHIFERLYQVHSPARGSRKGLGLGLFICKELVTRQGGEIWVSSQPGAGSIFSFTLPVFSLRTLIAPLLKRGRWPSENVALIHITVSFPESASSEAQNGWSREIRETIDSCLLPNLDVFLPKMKMSSGTQERFSIAAFTDEKGVAVLVERMREQFEALPDTTRAAVSISISHAMLVPVPLAAEASVDETLDSMAALLEAAMNSQTHAEVTA
jgi:PAS domain S-box-containing protein